ncbi:MAG: RsmG family class I SAM-dependent methyltransferase, partial [Prevotella sp.]|nr:RsmG family class I SAM-dependent methyltransferase [Prevotella sp.]
DRHIRDCLESVPLLPHAGKPRRVIDVGSGGGLPGLVWAICRPDLEVFLLDSIGKKARRQRVPARIAELYGCACDGG